MGKKQGLDSKLELDEKMVQMHYTVSLTLFATIRYYKQYSELKELKFKREFREINFCYSPFV